MTEFVDSNEQLKTEQFYRIIKEELIRPVYQPIVSLVDGEVMGYEALSRITLEDCVMNPEQLFCMAGELDCLWKLEELCRRKSLMGAMGKPEDKKLFLNVDPYVIEDADFKAGMTRQYLKVYGLHPSDIIFEITERSSIDSTDVFREVIDHYKNQAFQVAIDDYGTGYAGMKRVCALQPEYIKIDMGIVRDINRDSLKKSVVESMVQLSEKTGIKMIAEGIETREELRTLIRLGVTYGQGYYLLRPQAEMREVPDKVRDYIRTAYNETYSFSKSYLGSISNICNRKETTTPDTMVKDIYSFLKNRPEITEVTVLDPFEHVVGMLTRTDVMTAFGGRYGYDLSAKKRVKDLMNKKPLIVDESDSVEKVSNLALLRPQNTLYDAVIVTSKGYYEGTITVKELLKAAITVQVQRAEEANPLTGLPGNHMIDEVVNRVLQEQTPFSIIYIDLDNFKAYNDAYGFNKGDMMIKAVAESMEEACENNEFMGHVGG